MILLKQRRESNLMSTKETKKGFTPKKQAPKTEGVLEEKKKSIAPMDVDAVKKSIRDDVIKQAGIDESQAQVFLDMMEEATMPVEMSDEEFKLGPSELDIRHLSKKNTNQMLFRTLVLQNVYLKQLLTANIDSIRLLMVICDKIGVENISKATDLVVAKEKKLNNIQTKPEDVQETFSEKETKTEA